MKAITTVLICAVCSFASVMSFAQPAVEGVWAGKLEASPGSVISVQFTLGKDPAGAWTAVLNSPDNGAIKNVKATAVTFDGSRLDIKVDPLSGSYSGVLSDGTFTGEWSQPGSKIAMNLESYQAPQLSEEAVASLLGQWHGKLQAPGMTMNVAFHFERDASGAFVGFLQQVDTGPAKVPMADISLENNELFFRVPQARVEYRATLTPEGGYNGSVKQGPQNMVLNVVKGEFVPEQIKLALTDADYEKLAGEWLGEISPPGAPGAIPVVLTFKRDESNAVAGTFTMQNPQQNAVLRITTASIAGNTVSVAVAVPPAGFSGELNGSTITGAWTQGPNSLPLTFTKK